MRGGIQAKVANSREFPVNRALSGKLRMPAGRRLWHAEIASFAFGTARQAGGEFSEISGNFLQEPDLRSTERARNGAEVREKSALSRKTLEWED